MMPVLGLFPGETHEHWFGDNKPRSVIRENMFLKLRIISF